MPTTTTTTLCVVGSSCDGYNLHSFGSIFLVLLCGIRREVQIQRMGEDLFEANFPLECLNCLSPPHGLLQ
jgi:hypothetical protein